MTEPHRDEIAKLEALHGEHPEGRVFTHLAEAYRKAGEHGRALETIEAGLVRHSEYASAHVVRGRVLLDLGQEEGAAAAFRNVLELDRHNLIALRALGDLARAGGRPEEALGYFRELQTIDPADPELSTEVERLERAIAGEPIAAERGGLADQDTAQPVSAEQATAEPGSAEPVEAGHGEEVGAGEGIRIEQEWDEPAGIEEGEAGAGVEEIGAGVEEIDAGAAAADRAPAEEAEDGLLMLESMQLAGPESAEPEAADRPWPDSWWSGGSGTAEADDGAEPAMAEEPEGIESAEEGADFHWTFPGWGEEEEAVEVRTETMAALYASQGLWVRAADIYRGLLAERPGDAGLEERLRDAEARIREAAASGPAAVEPGAPSEQWLEGVESAWTGGQGVATPSASPYDWEEDAEEVTPGPSAGEYLKSLAEWRPGRDGAADASPAGGVVESDEGEAALREWLAEEPESAGESDWPPPSAVEPSGEEPAGEEDEDVEMFRTWLQSLRK